MLKKTLNISRMFILKHMWKKKSQNFIIPQLQIVNLRSQSWDHPNRRVEGVLVTAKNKEFFSPTCLQIHA